ncbi:MAS20-domain-containing protein [Armillaria nabsnona]|nr:MAS20-domain-containing protein [Armillaria nabsnona]
MSSRTTTAVVAGAAVAGLVAYAVYFDYKRRNDAEFRKRLRKEKKRVDKSIASSSAQPSAVSADSLREALERVKKEEVPLSPAERENYFMSQVAMGEQLALQGPDFQLPAALSFYRALRVYPSPVELMVIYEKTVPEPIFKMVIQMTNLDVTAKVQGYYNYFPPKSTGVEIRTEDTPEGPRKYVAVIKDFKKGDLIYKEHPIVTALDADIQSAGTHCSHCLRLIESSISIKSPSDPLSSTYCSKACQLLSKSQSHNLLFTTERPLPAEIPMDPPTPEILEERRKAQAAFVAYLQKEGKAGPLLVARFVARQIAFETLKLMPGYTGKPDEQHFTDSEGEEYMLADHMERLRYIEADLPTEEAPLLAKVLGSAVADLDKFMTDEHMAQLRGKIAYNAYGVCFGEGRDDKPAPTQRPEDVEKARTPYGTSRQIGSAFYTLSSYLAHSCRPSAHPSFSSGTAQIHIIADQDLKQGDEVTVAFVDVTQHEGESDVECKRRRRIELARGWKFACACQRCNEEAKTESNGVATQKDETNV